MWLLQKVAVCCCFAWAHLMAACRVQNVISVYKNASYIHGLHIQYVASSYSSYMHPHTYTCAVACVHCRGQQHMGMWLAVQN